MRIPFFLHNHTRSHCVQALFQVCRFGGCDVASQVKPVYEFPVHVYSATRNATTESHFQRLSKAPWLPNLWFWVCDMEQRDSFP